MIQKLFSKTFSSILNDLDIKTTHQNLLGDQFEKIFVKWNNTL